MSDDRDKLEPRNLLLDLALGWLRYLPPWNLRTAIEMAWFAFTISVLGACVVYAFGDMFGVWPVGRPMEAEQYEELVEDASDECARKLIKQGWRAP